MELFLTSLKVGILIAAVSIGFNLVYGVLKFLNIAHAELVVLSALLAEKLSIIFPFSIAVILTVFLSAGAGLIASKLLFRPLRLQPRGAMLATSLALALILHIIYSLVTKQAAISLRPDVVQFGKFYFFWNNLGFSIILIFLITLILEIWLRYTKLGQAVLVTADNPTIAEAWGVPVGLIYDFIFSTSFALAAVAGLICALYYSISFGFAFKIMVWSFSAILLGGLGSIVGGILASFFVAILWVIFGWLQIEPFVDSIILVVCAILFIFLPNGILGRKIRVI